MLPHTLYCHPLKAQASPWGGRGGVKRHLDLLGCLLQYQIGEIMEESNPQLSMNPLSSKSAGGL